MYAMTYLENLTIDEKFNKLFRFFIHQTMCLKCVEKKKLLESHSKDGIPENKDPGL